MIEGHHIIYKKQATIVDYPLNIIHLDSEEHRGDLGPHKNRETDLKYKRQLELNLRDVLGKSHYTIEELIKKLMLNKKQAYKGFKKTPREPEGISKQEAIKALLGGRYYIDC